jgi:putative DNA primase/helicase
VLILRDEAQGFFRSLDKPGREDARAFYIECWPGDGRHTVDRIGRGTLDIPACCVSILATIQPGPLQSYLFDAVNGGKGDDGLMPRFQLAVWPDVSADWRNVDRWPDTSARQVAYETIQRLADLEPFTIEAQHDDHNAAPFLRFDPEAQVAFNGWLGKVEHAVRAGKLPTALEAVLAKYRSLVPSLALLIHLADGGCGPVPVSALERAVGWARYLFAHALRIYGVVPTPESEREAELREWILERGGTVTGRDLAHGLRRFRSNAAGAEAALDALVKAGYGEWVPVPPGPRGGRATREFRLLSSVPVTTTHAKPGRNGGSGDGDAMDIGRINDMLAEVAEVDGD